LLRPESWNFIVQIVLVVELTELSKLQLQHLQNSEPNPIKLKGLPSQHLAAPFVAPFTI